MGRICNFLYRAGFVMKFFLLPQAGFVMKSFLLPEGTRKIFINVCHSDMVSVATSSPGQSRNARKRKKGQQWSIPYSVTPPREDLDKCEKIKYYGV